MEEIVLVIHVIVALAIIGLILVQQGKGAEMGASFGGASQTFFGSQGSGSFLTRFTAILVALFFITSLSLGYITAKRMRPTSIDELLTKTQNTIPAAPAKEGDIPKLPN